MAPFFLSGGPSLDAAGLLLLHARSEPMLTTDAHAITTTGDRIARALAGALVKATCDAAATRRGRSA